MYDSSTRSLELETVWQVGQLALKLLGTCFRSVRGWARNMTDI